MLGQEHISLRGAGKTCRGEGSILGCLLAPSAVLLWAPTKPVLSKGPQPPVQNPARDMLLAHQGRFFSKHLSQNALISPHSQPSGYAHG